MRSLMVASWGTSAPLPKFVIHRGTLSHELRKQRGTSKHMILVPLFDLKFLNELAAGVVGTSNRRHWLGRSTSPKARSRLALRRRNPAGDARRASRYGGAGAGGGFSPCDPARR